MKKSITVGCVIMASGLSRRFGANKLLADFCGQPMLCRAFAATATPGIAARIVVTRSEEVQALCRAQGVPVLLHSLPGRNDTVRLGLSALLEQLPELNGCMFLPGDQPLLRRETVAALALAAKNDRAFIWRTAFEEIPGSPVLFPAWAFPELTKLPEGKGGGFLVKKYPERLRTVSVRDRYELMDADSPEDLAFLVER